MFGYTLEEAALRLRKPISEVLEMLKKHELSGVYENGAWSIGRVSVDVRSPDGGDGRWIVPTERVQRASTERKAASQSPKPVFGIPKAVREATPVSASSVAQAARYVGVSEDTIHQLILQGQVRASRDMSGQWLVEDRDIARLAQERARRIAHTVK